MADILVESESRRLLTPGMFENVLDGEIKRAARLRGHLTLVVVAARELDGQTADDATVAEMAAVVMRQVRDTDVIAATTQGVISLALLDAELSTCARVIDRLVQRIGGCDFARVHKFSLGAACFPTDAGDVASLTRQALASPVMNWQGGSPDLRIRD